MPRLLLLLGLFFSFGLQASPVPLNLTSQEQDWLEAHPSIRLGIDPDWAPFEFVDSHGHYSGMAADYIALLSQKLGITLTPVSGLSWSDVLTEAQNKRLDVLPAATATPQREQYLKFTAPYLDFPMVIITRDDAPFVASLEALYGRRVAVVKDYVSHELLANNHPELELSPRVTLHDSLEALSSGEVDAFVGNLASVTHTINQFGISNLKVAAHTRYSFKLGMAVRDDWPELVVILDKALNSISREEQMTIRQKWGAVELEQGVRLTTVLLIILGVILIAAAIVAILNGINRRLRREIDERHQAEQQLRQSEQALRQSQAIAHIGNYTWEVEQNMTSWSDELYHIVGRSPESFVPSYEGYLDCLHPEDRSGFLALTSQVIEECEPYSGEYRILRPDGEIRYIHEKGDVYLDKAGKLERLVGVIHDITESKLRDLELHEKQQTLQTILDNAPIGIWLQDCEGKLRFVNSAYCDAVGISEKQFLEVDHYSELYPEAIAANCIRSDEEALATELPHISHEQIEFIDGKIHDLEIIKARLIDDRGEACGLIGLSMDITERKLAEEKLRKQAFCDNLTGLPNRNYLMEQLGKSVAMSRRHHYYSALLFFDLDNFKIINDTLGHHTGDRLLHVVGKRISDTIRQEDTAARLGGDEFVIIATNLGEDAELAAEQARLIAEKLQRVLSHPIQIDEHVHHLTMSIGINIFPIADENSHDILKFADTAMYRAKESGRDAIRFFQPSMQQAAEERFAMQGMMRKALANEEFELHYQPQYDHSGNITGAESLLRWQQPELGMISPARFIPLAEESGMITNIGIWVLRQACEQLIHWQTLGLKVETLAVNVSPRQFHLPDFVNQVRAIINESGIDPKYLELELTEGILIKNINEVTSKIEQLQALGIRFAIDDFGTGYSSLRYLQRLPLDKLKIDQSFVRDIHTNESNAHIVETIISMAHHLKMELIAEGVETVEELKFLNIRGVSSYQGYYFSKPLPAAEFTEKLQQQSAA